MKPKNDLSRRDLLKNASLAGAAAAAGSFASTEASAAQAVPTRWDREADVVVIGSGACGMPAAIVAREAGSSVIMIDAEADIADQEEDPIVIGGQLLECTEEGGPQPASSLKARSSSSPFGVR